MKPISQSVFSKFFNDYSVEKYYAYLNASKIIRIKEHLHFLSQIAHESNNLKHKKESHYYSLQRIKQIFPKYFKNVPDMVIKDKYERKAALLDRVYANRMLNGNEASRDGSRYRGRSYIQLTGKRNYRKFGFEKNPQALLNEKTNWMICLQFWRLNSLDDLCDDNFSDLSDKEIKKITRKINGGWNGFNDRARKADRIEKFYLLKQMNRL